MHHEVGEASTHSFESWLRPSSGGQVDFDRIVSYMERSELEVGECFCFGRRARRFHCAPGLGLRRYRHHRYGHGRQIMLRRMIGHTIVGEMDSIAVCHARRM